MSYTMFVETFSSKKHYVMYFIVLFFIDKDNEIDDRGAVISDEFDEAHSDEP